MPSHHHLVWRVVRQIHPRKWDTALSVRRIIRRIVDNAPLVRVVIILVGEKAAAPCAKAGAFCSAHLEQPLGRAVRLLD